MRSILLLLSLSLGASASTADVIGNLQSLNEQGRFSDAYRIALQSLDQFEGDPRFDMQYGVSAIDSGHVSEGIFALERVVFLEPGNALAKLELARGYFLLGQFEKSRALFVAVRKLNPPPPVLSKIDLFLTQIKDKTTIPPTKVSSFVELWAGYDSNINSGPGGQSPGVTLSDSALGRGDQFNQLRLNGSIEHAYSPDHALLFSANAKFRYYHTEAEQDYRDLTFNVGHLWKGEGEQYLLNFTVNDYRLNLEDYRTLLGVNGVWSKQLGRKAVVKSFVGLNSLNYDETSWKDATQINAGVNYLRLGEGAWNPLYFAGVFMGDETPKTAGVLANGQVDRLFAGGNLGVQLTPFTNFTFTPSLTYQHSRYQGNDWLYGYKRRDDFLSFNLNAEWVMDQDWTLLLNYGFTDVDSNIAIYEYDRQQVMLGVRYNFQ